MTAAKPLSKVLFGAAAFFAAKVPMGLAKLRKLDKYNENYGAKA